jgi:predicted nucleotidyltransferase
MNHEYILPYVEQLVREYPRIESVWLFGSRANDSYREDSDWDLLVFANKEILVAMGQHRKLKLERVDVLVVYDSIHFEEPWPEENGRARARGGRLSGSTPLSWEWNQTSQTEARYEEGLQGGQTERTIKKALKLWPQERAA